MSTETRDPDASGDGVGVELYSHRSPSPKLVRFLWGVESGETPDVRTQTGRVLRRSWGDPEGPDSTCRVPFKKRRVDPRVKKHVAVDEAPGLGNLRGRVQSPVLGPKGLWGPTTGRTTSSTCRKETPDSPSLKRSIKIVSLLVSLLPVSNLSSCSCFSYGYSPRHRTSRSGPEDTGRHWVRR